MIDYYLVINQTNNDDTDVHLNNINDILEYMEIDEKIFYLKVYKDQASFLVKDEKNIMKRLQNSRELLNYHKLSKEEKDIIIANSKLEEKQENTAQILDEDEIAIKKFQKIFNKRFEIQKKIAINELELLLEIPEVIEIPGKNIALEITKQNQKQLGSIAGYHMIFVLIYIFIP